MPLPFNKNFDEIDEKDISSLIKQGVRENQNLEYKSETWKSNDEGIREMMRDITSIANAYGGYIIIGIKEDKNGIPLEIQGVNDAEKERDRITSSCLANISPRLIGIKLKVIKISGKDVLVIFLPRGIRSPYMITFTGLYQFWIRHDRQKSRMSVDEIRDAISKTENLFADLKEFIDRRKKEILEEIGENPCYVIGAIPLSTVKEEVVDVLDDNIRNILKSPPGQDRYNGFNFNYGPSDARPHCTLQGLKIGKDYESTELFRNGYLEARVPSNCRLIVEQEVMENNGNKRMINALISKVIIGYSISFYQLLKTLKEHLGLEEPFIGFTCLYNIKGLALQKDIENWHPIHYFSFKFWDKQNLEIPPSQIPDLSNPDKVAKFFVDRIWQAFEWDYAPLWNEKEQKFKFKY